MPYRFIDEIATADVAFEATGADLEDAFAAAAEALLAVMVADRQAVSDGLRRTVSLEAESDEMLLIDFLQELIFLKDRDQILLWIHQISIEAREDRCRLTAILAGEKLDYARHDLVVDVKAVTLHEFKLEKTQTAWRARVILDI